MKKSHILIVDDRHDIVLSTSFVLEDNSYVALAAHSPDEAKQMLKLHPVDLILLDMNFSRDITSGEEGIGFLAWLAESEFSLPVVAMTAWSNVHLAVRAMQQGAGDFIEKPWENQRLLQIIKQQLALSGLQKQNQHLQQRQESPLQHEYVWQSESMTVLLQQIKHVANTDVNILLTGENGTGKSYIATKVHQYSQRHAGPFISVNMGAIAEQLFESELFGHKKGAFTDAKSNRIGRIELATNGTLFLDEIANIPLSQQAKLLRVLESGEYEVLGSSHTQTMDTRIISATNANLEKKISQDAFREDLFYRLNTLEFKVPALRERQCDIVPLAEHFIAMYCHKYARASMLLSEAAKELLIAYPWPGNLRELNHLMERAVLLCDNSCLQEHDIHMLMPRAFSNKHTPPAMTMMTLEQAERTLIKQALQSTANNMTQAAKLLGLTKSSLYRRLEKYDDLQK